MPEVLLGNDLTAVVAARQAAQSRGDAEEFYRLRARERRLRSPDRGGVVGLQEHDSEAGGASPPTSGVQRRIEELEARGLSEAAAKALARSETSRAESEEKQEPDEKTNELREAALSAQARKNLPASAFVFPKQRRYPIHDLAHARNALARAAGKPEEAKVKSAVYAKHPELKDGGDKKKAQETLHFAPESDYRANPLAILRDKLRSLEEGQKLSLPSGVSVERLAGEGAQFKIESEWRMGDAGHVIEATSAEMAARHVLPMHERRRKQR